MTNSSLTRRLTVQVSAWALLAVSLQTAAFGQVTWTGAALDGQWSTPTNWDSNNVPVATDDVVFGATTGTTNITWASGIDNLNTLTFTPSAPAYTITKSFSDLAPQGTKVITNNSPNLQTLNTGVNSGTYVSAAGPITFNSAIPFGGTDYFYGPLNLWLNKDITLNTRLASNGRKDVYGPNGPNTVPSDMTGVTGKFILNTDTGTANSNSTGNFTGQAHVWSGTLDVRSANALGRAANNTFVHGTWITAASTQAPAEAQLQDGYEHGFGALALDNNITLGEAIRIDSRIGDVADFDQIVNISGTNTLTNLNTMGGGGHYNYNSVSGTLIYQNPANNHSIQITDGPRMDSAASDWINSVFTFRGAGDFNIQTNISAASGAGQANMVSIVRKDGTGTLTLSPVTGGTATSNNNWDGGTLLDAGKIVVAAGANISTVGQNLYVASGATLDVSANASGLTFADAGNNRLNGSGTIVGDVTINGDTTNAGLHSHIQPGGVATLLSSADPHQNDSITYAPGAGILTLSNALTMSAGGQYDWNLAGLSTSGAGTNFDQLIVSGALTLGGSSKLNIDLSLLSGSQQPGGGNSFWNTSHTWTIISNANNPGNSNFASIINGVVATGTFTTSVDPGLLLGDVNGDHVVNGLDIAVVASHWLLTGATLGQGDANGDGTVNGLDIALIASHWLSTGGGSGGSIILTYTPSAGGGTAVPEPSSVALAVMGLVGLFVGRRHRRLKHQG